jgi:hypothetical protein
VRAWALLLGGGALVAIGGCTVGQGSGSAMGNLYVLGCNNGASFGTLTPDGQIAPVSYNMQPSFFAGAPNETLAQGPDQMNEITLRMQSSGLSIMYTDTLAFTVVNSYQVARCLRGRIDQYGQPDWNVTEPLPPIFGTAGNLNPTTLWCDWSATAFTDGGPPDAAATTAGGPDGGAMLDGGMSVMAQYPRIHLTPYTDVSVSLEPLATCFGSQVTAQGSDGWIEFQSFGGAEQPNVPPAARDRVPQNFIINFGDRLHATFHIVLQDSRIAFAIEQNKPIPTTPHIGGTLDGYFDFELARGRAAQPWP